MSATALHGKYRGIVREHGSGPDLGRIRVEVQDVLGSNVLGFALPVLPGAGSDSGLFFVPPVGSWVWVEFEAGDSTRPLWSGGCWGPDELPAEVTSTDIKVFKTTKATVLLDDAKGELTLRLNGSGGQPVITLSSNGIKLDNGNGATIELTGTSVKINGSALEVT